MPNKTTIDFNTILKRSRSKSSIVESANNNHWRLYDNFTSAINKSKDGTDYNVNNCMKLYSESMKNNSDSTKYYWEPLRLVSEMEKCNLNNLANEFVDDYINNILPYVEDTREVINDIDRFEISESYKESINIAAKKYLVADRVMKNHDTLFRHINVSEALNHYKAGGTKELVEFCTKIIDNYGCPDYQKMNIAIEEIFYIQNRYGLECNKKELASAVTEHYLLLNSTLTDDDIEKYKRTLDENYILSEDDLSSVRYLYEDFDITSVDTGIKSYLKNQNKTPELVVETVSSILENSTKSNLVNNASELWNFISLSDSYTVGECVDLIYTKIETAFENNSITKEEAKTIIDSVSEDYHLSDIIDIEKMLYEAENLSAIKLVNAEGVEVPLNEFKIFKFHNLITAAINLDKFLKRKESKVINNGKNKLSKLMKKTKSVLFGESVTSFSENIMDYIGSDHRAEIVLRQYVFDEDEEEELSTFLSHICEEYNDLLYSQNATCRCYYIINPGIAEIKIKDPAKLQLENDDPIFEAKDPSVDLYIDILAETLSFLDEYSFPTDSDDDDDEDEDDEENAKPEVKKPKVGGAVNKDDKSDDKKKDSSDSKKPSKKDDEIPKLDPPKGKLYKAQVNLNAIRLGLEGLKAKFKDLSTKEKEASRNMDNAARAFAKAAKDSLVADRREAIIKGSLIPSFSRCMKNAIILAGVAHFSLPAAVIGAIGALALSAKLTKNERLLLLDEIDTELEVVDKELAIADSNNQINKYRELLKYKKNLQRQYQRIRYNIRVGKDIAPMSSAGVPRND